MNEKIIASYSIFLGVSIIFMWVLILTGNQITEGVFEITLHLISEFLMAVFCILSGVLILKRGKKGRILNILAHGIVLYSVLNATGYYGQRGDYAFIILFFILFILSLLVIIFQLKKAH